MELFSQELLADDILDEPAAMKKEGGKGEAAELESWSLGFAGCGPQANQNCNQS